MFQIYAYVIYEIYIYVNDVCEYISIDIWISIKITHT